MAVIDEAVLQLNSVKTGEWPYMEEFTAWLFF
jgi:hypothetical protein